MIDEKLMKKNMHHMMVDNNCGKVSDGDHTFDELYDHRCTLFAALCNTHPEMAWKSLHHDDGSMFDNYFICGMNTPYGQATYHYHISKWNLFHVQELTNAPKYDGHTPEEALERISKTFNTEGGK